MNGHRAKVFTIFILFVAIIFNCSCTHVPTTREQLASLESATGLKVIEPFDSKVPLLGKTQDGYKIAARFQIGDVWGRYAARLAMGEIGRELGGIWGFLVGQGKYISSVTGSPLDRLLSYAIGQPLSLTVVLSHEKPAISRLDILSAFSVIKPHDLTPQQKQISYFGAGTLYSNDGKYAHRVLANKIIEKGLSCFRSQYIRVDNLAVSFLFSGSENEYSAMIRDCGGYNNLINTIIDVLVQLAREA